MPYCVRRLGFMILGAAIALPVFYVATITSQHPKSLVVSGQVIEGTTGKPASNARVIISAWDWYFFSPSQSDPHLFGLTTDAEGRYRMAKKCAFRISRITVQASGQNDTFGSTTMREHRDHNQPINVTIVPRTDLASQRRYRHETFLGSFAYDRNDITFIADTW